jgi:hypothetical protein
VNNPAETTASRLWRDRVQIREHERDHAQERARIAEQKVAILTAENHRLATENATLRAQLVGGAAQASTQIECQMEALRDALTHELNRGEVEGEHDARRQARAVEDAPKR